jgi:CheY-like chemotaxis protein
MLERQKKLLIVDDDVSLLSLLSRLFSQLGYCVRSAGDGSSALSAIENELPDILLSDLKMPGIPGILFLLIVRQNFPSIRVVSMSGAYLRNRVPSCVAADAFYGKGTSLHLLTQAVEDMTRTDYSTMRPDTEDLSGFTVFENVLIHPGSAQWVHSSQRSMGLFASQAGGGFEQPQGQAELPGIRQEAIVERGDAT